MASGVRTLLGADLGLSLTGVAGPDPQDGQPPGTLWIGVADGDERGDPPRPPPGTTPADARVLGDHRPRPAPTAPVLIGLDVATSRSSHLPSSPPPWRFALDPLR